MSIKLTVMPVVWIDLQIPDGRNASQHQMLVLIRKFLQWQLDTNVFPIAKGHSGPLGFSGGYSPDKAELVIAWMKANGIV